MLVKRFKQAVFNQFKKQEADEHSLGYLFWECTLRCNLNCKHCGSDCLQDSRHKDMPMADFLSVLDQIKEAGTHRPDTLVVITGGEPLLRTDLETCGYEIRSRGFQWGIVTNGYAYTPERHNSLLNAGMSSITVSLDGLEPHHTWMRINPKSHQRAVAAIELIARERRLNYDVVTCVNKKNIPDLEEIRQLLLSKNIREWRLFTITPIGRAREHEEMSLTQVEFTRLMEFIKEARKDPRIRVNFSCEGYVGKYETTVRDSFFFCRAGIHIGSVLVNGDISACPNIDRSFVQGNIYTDRFMNVWNNRFQLFRNREWTRTGRCAHCKEYKNCGGNGLHYWKADRQEVMQCHRGMIVE